MTFLSVFFANIAFAQSTNAQGSVPTLSRLIEAATNLLGQLIPFAIGLAVVVFLFGVIRYVTAGAGEEKATARNLMIYGIIAIFVMVSVWGLVNFIQSSTGIGGGQTPPPPNLPSF